MSFLAENDNGLILKHVTTKYSPSLINMEERHCKPSMMTASGFVKMRGHFTVDKFGFPD